MKTSAIIPMLALAALAACGGGNDDETTAGVDTTGTAATVTPMDTTSTMAPPMAPMPTDSMGAMGGTGTDTAAGANQSDTLIKVDSTKKM